MYQTVLQTKTVFLHLGNTAIVSHNFWSHNSVFETLVDPPSPEMGCGALGCGEYGQHGRRGSPLAVISATALVARGWGVGTGSTGGGAFRGE